MITPSKHPLPATAGKLKITPGPNSSYQLHYTLVSNPERGGNAFYQMAVSQHEGYPLAFVPAGGSGSPMPPYPQPSVLAFIISDRDQLWGRTCPSCRSYFRTNHISGMTVCPYCTFAEDAIYFTPDSHLRYLKKFVEAVERAVEDQTEFEIDLDEATDHSEWTYTEWQLQHRFECAACNVSTDILGEYGSCPSCGKRNSGTVFHRKLNTIEAETDTALDDKRPDLLNRVVSLFEGMANDLKRVLASMPCHPRRAEQIAALNFQDISMAVRQLSDWYGFDLDRGLKPGEMALVDLMFKRRNLFTHNEGRVDEKYLKLSGDSAFQLNELIVLEKEELTRFIPLVRKLVSNFIADVEAVEVHGAILAAKKQK